MSTSLKNYFKTFFLTSILFCLFSLILGIFLPLWHTLSAPRVVDGLHISPHVTFLYNWIIFRHNSGYKHRKICSVKIILKTSFLSDFDPFMGFQQFLWPLGYPNVLTMEMDFSQESLRCQPALKNCFSTTFFHVNSAKTLIWSFSLFWGNLGGL